MLKAGTPFEWGIYPRVQSYGIILGYSPHENAQLEGYEAFFFESGETMVILCDHQNKLWKPIIAEDNNND
jgi:hypothetical protein